MNDFMVNLILAVLSGIIVFSMPAATQLPVAVGVIVLQVWLAADYVRKRR